MVQHLCTRVRKVHRKKTQRLHNRTPENVHRHPPSTQQILCLMGIRSVMDQRQARASKFTTEDLSLLTVGVGVRRAFNTFHRL